MLFWQTLLWSHTPPNGHIESHGKFAEGFERPSFLWVAGKGMDDGEVLGRLRRYGDVRNSFRGRRQCGKKRERKMADGIAEFGTVGSVPGIDGVERFELGDAGAFDHPEQIQSGIGNRPGAVGEASQGQQRPRGPDFGIRGARSFESGERKDDVADGPGADEKSTAGDKIACPPSA